jgi:hypothetical protein
VFARENALLADRLDLETLTLDGDTVSLGGPVATLVGSAPFSASVDGRVLVCAPAAGIGKRGFEWVARDGRTEAIGLPPGAYGQVRVSSDGRRVTVSSLENIWVSELARPGLIRIGSPSGRFSGSVWAPGDDAVVFGTFTDGVRRARGDGTGELETLFAPNEPSTVIVPDVWQDERTLFVTVWTGASFARAYVGRLLLDPCSLNRYIHLSFPVPGCIA